MILNKSKIIKDIDSIKKINSNKLLITEKLLSNLNACDEAIEFVKRNGLIGFPLNRLDEIEGDYNGYVKWIKSFNYIICVNENLVYYERPNYWKYMKYNKKGNLIFYIDNSNNYGYYDYNNSGFNLTEGIIEPKNVDDEVLIYQEFDNNGNLLFYSKNDEIWQKYEYDEKENLLSITYSDGNYEKLKYDTSGNLIYHEGSDMVWKKMEYDLNGNCIKYEDGDGCWEKMKYDSNKNLIYRAFGNILYDEEHIYDDWQKYEYDSNNNLISVYDKSRNVIEFENSFGYINKSKYDEKGNCVECEINGYVVITPTTFYDNGQLKSIGDMIIPKI